MHLLPHLEVKSDNFTKQALIYLPIWPLDGAANATKCCRISASLPRNLRHSLFVFYSSVHLVCKFRVFVFMTTHYHRRRRFLNVFHLTIWLIGIWHWNINMQQPVFQTFLANNDINDLFRPFVDVNIRPKCWFHFLSTETTIFHIDLNVNFTFCRHKFSCAHFDPKVFDLKVFDPKVIDPKVFDLTVAP